MRSIIAITNNTNQYYMKKLLIYALASGFLFTSCQKEDESETTNSSGLKAGIPTTISPMPTTFVKKVLVEEFTSTTEGLAPESTGEIYKSIKGNNNRIYHAGLHSQDIMTNFQTNRLVSTLGSSPITLPCATINRTTVSGNAFLNPNQYNTTINNLLLQNIKCGLAMSSSVARSIVNIDIHVGFASNYNGTYNLTTYLIEDNVTSGNPAFDQSNSLNNTQGSAYYNIGNPILGYNHKNIIRKVVSKDLGDQINPTVVNGGTGVMSYTIDLPKKLGTNSTWKIISFITDATDNQVLNVQMSDVGTVKDWN